MAVPKKVQNFKICIKLRLKLLVLLNEVSIIWADSVGIQSQGHIEAPIQF